jgi:hypothetical protein
MSCEYGGVNMEIESASTNSSGLPALLLLLCSMSAPASCRVVWPAGLAGGISSSASFGVTMDKEATAGRPVFRQLTRARSSRRCSNIQGRPRGSMMRVAEAASYGDTG